MRKKVEREEDDSTVHIRVCAAGDVLQILMIRNPTVTFLYSISIGVNADTVQQSNKKYSTSSSSS